MRALIIDDKTAERVAEVLKYAAINPFVYDALDVFNIATKPAPGDRPEHVCLIPIGYRAVFSIDILRGVTYKHLSVSVDKQGALPNVPAVQEIMKLFGIESDLSDCVVKIEVMTETHSAINIFAES